MKKTLVLTIAVMLSSIAVAQATPPIVNSPPPEPKGAEVTVKETPASQSLLQLAKDQVSDQKAVNDIFQQARASLDQNQKALQDELQSSVKGLNAKLAEDKKYKPLVDHINDLNKQIQEAQSKAQSGFQQKVSVVQNKANTESAQVQVLIPIVRKENGLPDTATFDVNTLKWTVPPAAKK